jgi:hypothetical protein
VSPTIHDLLKRRGASLKGGGGSLELARGRAALTMELARNYALFEGVRDGVLLGGERPLSPPEQEMLARLLAAGVVRSEDQGHVICEVNGKRYLSGGWLEELAFLAAVGAGADEAVYGQNLTWSFKGYSGENEVDLIARRGDVLSFVSCKALRSELDMQDRKQRNRLMDAVHEADNLADHFGHPGERVAVLVTTDLFDEMKGAPRYSALMGKAAVLDVRIIALEDLGWDRLVRSFAELWEERTAA